jgi:hypothetical protein
LRAIACGGPAERKEALPPNTRDIGFDTVSVKTVLLSGLLGRRDSSKLDRGSRRTTLVVRQRGTEALALVCYRPNRRRWLASRRGLLKGGE